MEYNRFKIGDKVRVRNGAPEPPKRFHRKLASWQSRNFDGTVVELPSSSVFPGYTVRDDASSRSWITIQVAGLPERQLTHLASTPYRDPAEGEAA